MNWLSNPSINPFAAQSGKYTSSGNGLGISNPYQGHKLQRSGFLGSSTASDKAAYEQDVAAAEWDSNMQLYMYEQWYNSPEQEAARMRAAGMNPDLSGLDGVAEATSMNPVSGMSAPEGQSGFQQAMSFVTDISSLASSISSMKLNAAQRKNLAVVNENLDTQGTINELTAMTALGNMFGTFSQNGLPIPSSGFSSKTQNLVSSYGQQFGNSVGATIGSRKSATTANTAYADMWKSVFGGGGVGNAELANDGVATEGDAGYETQQSLFKLGQDCIKAANKEFQRAISSADREISANESAAGMNYDYRKMLASLTTDESRAMSDAMNAAMAKVIKNYIDVNGKSNDPYQRYVCGQLAASYFKMVNPFTYHKFKGGGLRSSTFFDADQGASSPWLTLGREALGAVGNFF